MSNYLIDSNTLTAIANSIRAKKGTTANILTEDFASEIESIEGGGDNEALKSLIDRSVTEIEIPEGVTTIGNGVFYSCYNLENVIIPNGVTSIGERAFYNCSKLLTINFPNTVKTLGYESLRGCSRVASIDIPSSVNKIDFRAFYGWTNCLKYDFSSHTLIPMLGTNVFDSGNANAKIIVPEDLYSRWISATNWATWKGNIVSVGEASVNTTVPNDKVWLLGSSSWGRADKAGSVSPYYRFNNGEKTPLTNYTFGELYFMSDYYDNGYDFVLYGDAVFNEAGTYEIWVEDTSGKKYYWRILEVS